MPWFLKQLIFLAYIFILPLSRCQQYPQLQGKPIGKCQVPFVGAIQPNLCQTYIQSSTIPVQMPPPPSFYPASTPPQFPPNSYECRNCPLRSMLPTMIPSPEIISTNTRIPIVSQLENYAVPYHNGPIPVLERFVLKDTETKVRTPFEDNNATTTTPKSLTEEPFETSQQLPPTLEQLASTPQTYEISTTSSQQDTYPTSRPTPVFQRQYLLVPPYIPPQYPQQPTPQYPPQFLLQYPSQSPPKYPQQPFSQYPQQPQLQYPQQLQPQYPSQSPPKYPQQPFLQYPQQPQPQYPQQLQPQYPSQTLPKYPQQPFSQYPSQFPPQYSQQPIPQYPSQSLPQYPPPGFYGPPQGCLPPPPTSPPAPPPPPSPPQPTDPIWPFPAVRPPLPPLNNCCARCGVPICRQHRRNVVSKAFTTKTKNLGIEKVEKTNPLLVVQEDCSSPELQKIIKNNEFKKMFEAKEFIQKSAEKQLGGGIFHVLCAPNNLHYLARSVSFCVGNVADGVCVIFRTTT